MLWVQRLTIRNAAQDVFQLQMQRRYDYLEEANILANKIRDFPSCDGLEWVRQVEPICTARIYFPYNFQSGGYARYGGKRCYDGGRQLLPPFPHFSPFCPNSTCPHPSIRWNPPNCVQKTGNISFFGPNEVRVFRRNCIHWKWWFERKFSRRKLCWIKAVAAVNLSIGLSLN